MVEYFAVDEAICTIYKFDLSLCSAIWGVQTKTLSYPDSNYTKFISKFISAGGRYQVIEASNSKEILVNIQI